MPCDQTFFKVCGDFAFQNEVWKSTNHTHRSGYQIQWGDEKPLFGNECFHFLFWIFFFKPFYFTIDGYKFSFMFNWAKKEKVLDLNMLMRINVAMVNQDVSFTNSRASWWRDHKLTRLESLMLKGKLKMMKRSSRDKEHRP